MPQNYTGLFAGESAPGHDGVAITPSDTVNIPGGPCRAIWVGGAGDITIITVAGTGPLTYRNVPVGMFPVGAQRVNLTGTTATQMTAVW